VSGAGFVDIVTNAKKRVGTKYKYNTSLFSKDPRIRTRILHETQLEVQEKPSSLPKRRSSFREKDGST